MKLDTFSLWTALITPLQKNGETIEVDFDSLGSLIQEQARANNALLVLGSTGEALNLSIELKKKVLEYIVKLKKDLSLSLPIMVGVGGHNLEEVKKWISFLETLDIDAYLPVTPIYAKPNDYGQYQWFKEILDATSRPCMLYNVPSRSGTSLSLRCLAMLKEHKNFWAIKEASGSIVAFQQYKHTCPTQKIFCGDDALMDDFANHGASGLVSVASNAWPSETHKYVKECLKRELSPESKEIWSNASEALFRASNPVPVKKLLSLQKRIKSDILMPPLNAMDLRDTRELVENSQNIASWFSK